MSATATQLSLFEEVLPAVDEKTVRRRSAVAGATVRTVEKKVTAIVLPEGHWSHEPMAHREPKCPECGGRIAVKGLALLGRWEPYFATECMDCKSYTRKVRAGRTHIRG